MLVNHWVRKVMNEEVRSFLAGMRPEQLDIFEISGLNWHRFGFRSYESKWFPEFDICKHTTRKQYDVVIADQVFMYVEDPEAAAHNVMSLLRPKGAFVITTNFLVIHSPSPLDLWRWSADGLKLFLQRQGFQNVYTSSWGNKEALIANLDRWVEYDPARHSLHNDPAYPVSVWGIAKKP